MNVFEMFDARTIAAYWNEVASNRMNYVGPAFFPKQKKAGLDLAWIKGSKGLPITLMPSAFDAKARFRDRIGVSKVETEMPFFREGYYLKEKDRQEILRAQDSNDPYVEQILSHVFDDAAELIAGAEVVPERMIMQLLAPLDGAPGITITANNVNYTYNYDPDNFFQTNQYVALSGTSLWDATDTADPLTDIRVALDSVEARTGNRPRIALMSRTTFNYLLKNDAIRSAILAQNSTANIFMTEQLVRQAISSYVGVDILIYTKQYIDDEGTTQQFYPDGYVTLLPGGAIGSTWYGTTPEEADLMSGGTNASVAIVNTGVAITTIKTPHPVNIETLASEIVLPSFEGMDNCYLLKVTA